jgi:CRISPR-associated endonuclease Cas1
LSESNRPSIKSGVLVVRGYGISIQVDRGLLRISDGAGSERREIVLAKATSGLRRLVVLGHSGTVSLEALHWLHDIGAAFVQIDLDGEVIATDVPAGLDDARLRRAQALAASNGVGLALTRELLRDKLTGQLAVLSRFADAFDSTAVIHNAVSQFNQASTTEQLRGIEARGAAAYWSAWSRVPVQFARTDAKHVPAHWLTMGSRTSPLTSSTRLAANPVNALLNYVYAILEAEARIACLKVGLDPGMGLMHADQRSRDSLALDLIEPLRPQADQLVLDLLARRTMSRRDLFETREGGCRLMPSLTKPLAEHAPTIARWVAPVAESIARELLKPTGQTGPRTPASLPTPLTQANRSAGRDGIRKKASRPVPTQTLEVPNACKWCGVILENRERTWCDDCYAEHRVVKDLENIAIALATKQIMAAEGKDPAHGGEAAKKRGGANREHLRLNKEWETLNERLLITEEEFLAQISPQLTILTTKQICELMGVSRAYATKVRSGERVPHPRHWLVLRQHLGAEVERD